MAIRDQTATAAGGRLMPLQHAVLALLADGPSHGYDLKDRFEHAVGPQWGLNVGHLYQVLDRLRRDGLATTEVVTQSQRPDRTVYRITDDGRTELDTWLTMPVSRSRGYRDDFFLKLVAAARRDPEQLAAIIRTQRQRHLQELRSLGEARSTAPDDPITALLLDAAILHTEADLKLVDTAEAKAEQLLTTNREAGVGSRPRGRPHSAVQASSRQHRPRSQRAASE